MMALTAPHHSGANPGTYSLGLGLANGCRGMEFLTPPGFGSAGYSRAHVGGRINLTIVKLKERDSLGLSYGPKNLYLILITRNDHIFLCG